MNTPAQDDLTIIGIGSSAGGLEAIRELVANLPTDLQVSYVVVQHMSPHHKSLMKELVARETKLAVENVTDGVTPAANVIYITPPKTDVVFRDGKLHLVDPSKEPAIAKPSVDRFLISLAESHGARTMAIILSGTGSDGAYGVQAIREAGGITIAQDTESAKYDGMPQSAITTGCIDLILRPLDIGPHLHNILTSSHDFSNFQQGEFVESPITDLLQILLARTRVDFRDYKKATIGRRIERRMVALGIESQEEYTQFCRTNPHAVDDLFKDLLISVTRFFRDKEEFAQLQALLPKLIADRGDGPLRVWIAGCATGEEAYSIAILLAELLGTPTNALKSKVQIFATDIDKNALQVARRGSYNASALNDIPDDIAEKYFIHQGDSIRVVDSIRNVILFSDHNVCQDPPFQKIDLLCCRNLLIYFENNLQKKVMSRFHYSMPPHGLLFLGTAESVAGSENLFVADKSAPHIYHKRGLSVSKDPTYTLPQVPSISRRSTPRTKATENAPSTDRQLFEALVQSLGENSILVTEDYSIARVYGAISPYIEMNSATNLKMHIDLLRSPLREEARSLVTIALKNKSHRAGVRHLVANASGDEVRLDVYPIVASQINERAALVVFTPFKSEPVTTTLDTLGIKDNVAVSERIISLENEVATTRDALQQTIEELETSNEELQSLNEELQSTNEELQATNEELETSNEELQSTNEELITVNEELQVTASELSGRTGELTSVLQSTPLAILVTDYALQVRQATPAAKKMFNIEQPIGSPHISQIPLPTEYPALAPMCGEALKLGQTVSTEFSSNGTQVIITCSPYFEPQGQILGVTIVVSEFPGLARELEHILNSSGVLLMNRDRDGKILRISEQAAKIIGETRASALGKSLYDLIPENQANRIREDDRNILNNTAKTPTTKGELGPLDGSSSHHLQFHRFRYNLPVTNEPTIYTFATDLTETEMAHKRADALLDQIMTIPKIAGLSYWTLDPKTKEIYWSEGVFKIHRVNIEDGAPPYEEAINMYHPDDIDRVKAIVARGSESGEFKFRARLLVRSGEIVHIESHGIVRQDHWGETDKIVGIFRELSPHEISQPAADWAE
ncbi:two-component system CheB/CheR fusion protein [Pacificibacter maritimus]|uniref:protein-glutamate O-methyltransferase n=1 Tax=Pacificibacter maritimus TaxID=762213 RepID=A0A3N4ULW6_9RHOB|nr:chemotaxis protein CheB [Pacificibacter maritimus]RPE71443.1 two-component system CheB/CheR fusion protein [Pacificibacter maritimus]